MAIFRSKSKQEGPHPGVVDIKLGKGDKMTSTNYGDNRLLQAVNEAQPFEQAHQHETNADGSAHRRTSYLSQESENLKDIFGQPIAQGDMSNPTRSRNERPLDTIRAFEYAITRDLSYREQLETQRLGWGFHEDFPFYSFQQQPDQQQQSQQPGFERPVINFGTLLAQPIYQAPNYSASSLRPEGKKKAKKGLFGRKKK